MTEAYENYEPPFEEEMPLQPYAAVRVYDEVPGIEEAARNSVVLVTGRQQPEVAASQPFDLFRPSSVAERLRDYQARCGGCKGLGNHRRWCPAQIGTTAATFGLRSIEIDNIAGAIGPNCMGATAGGGPGQGRRALRTARLPGSRARERREADRAERAARHVGAVGSVRRGVGPVTIPIEDLRAACPHTAGRWELNPQTAVYTRRCTRCGEILDRRVPSGVQ